MRKRILLTMIIACSNSGCALLMSNGIGMNQAQIANFETRTVDAPLDAVYAAATEALFDLGYQIMHSEKVSGVLVGERHKTETELIPTKDPQRPFEKVEHTTTFNISLLIHSAGKKSTDVRIKTSTNGETRFNKKAIDEVWIYIDRQVLMSSPPTPVEKHGTKERSARKG